MLNIWEAIVRLHTEGRNGILITVIDKAGQGPSTVGQKMLVDAQGAVIGSVGGGELGFLAIKKAQELMSKHKHAVEEYNLSGDQPVHIGTNLDMLCGGAVTLFFEYLAVRPSLYIIGMGHVGRCLAFLMNTLNWNIVTVNYRNGGFKHEQNHPEIPIQDFADIIQNGIPPGCFVVIAGFSHEEDYQVLETIYRAEWQPRYIGLLASSNKSRLMVNKLVGELGGEIDLNILHSPVGLDIGGKMPEEIALSIAAEIQALRYNKKGNCHLSTNSAI